MTENRGFTDIHVHCVPRDGGTRFRGWRRLVSAWLATQAGVHGDGKTKARVYMDRLAQRLRNAPDVRRCVLLALDRGYDRRGEADPRRDGLVVTNADVMAWCREQPDLFLYGASVHPHRADALDALERVADEGAVLIKLIPNTQGFDPAASRHRPYFRKLAELKLPLLCHTGYELVLPVQKQRWGDVRRLRLALEEGVTVIAAHAGSTGLLYNGDVPRRLERMMRRYPNLYGDTAALGLVTRMGALLWWRDHPEWCDRLLFATDYPVPVTLNTWRPFLSRSAFRRLHAADNPFEQMVLLLEGLGIRLARDGFERLLERLGKRPA
ncbi:MAG TPA: metal-dependent hydrolase [Chromatiales bacterium]|nr:metal-dependent hydrolase [Chromatiales bacterium]